MDFLIAAAVVCAALAALCLVVTLCRPNRDRPKPDEKVEFL